MMLRMNWIVRGRNDECKMDIFRESSQLNCEQRMIAHNLISIQSHHFAEKFPEISSGKLTSMFPRPLGPQQKSFHIVCHRIFHGRTPEQNQY